VRAEKERGGSSDKPRRSHTTKQRIEVDEREGKESGVRGPPSSRSRRDRIYPDGRTGSSSRMSTSNAADAGRKPRRRSSKKGSSSRAVNLKVATTEPDDSLDDHDDDYTPRTVASTPSPTNGLRANSDLRSPGQRKSPKVAATDDSEAPLPDFITQTDKFGNASTPRSDTAIKQARELHPTGAMPHLHVDKDGKLTDDESEVDNVDACTETLLDSIRIMCCCLMPDETPAKKAKEEEKVTKKPIRRPSLLPELHPDDTGKKCLVLDLDETLVHSSFRAVPGADFVIPVQVRDHNCHVIGCLLLLVVRCPFLLPHKEPPSHRVVLSTTD